VGRRGCRKKTSEKVGFFVGDVKESRSSGGIVTGDCLEISDGPLSQRNNQLLETKSSHRQGREDKGGVKAPRNVWRKAVHGLTAGGLAPIKMKEDLEWSMMVGGDEERKSWKGLGDRWIMDSGGPKEDSE
jgi:hypothetical protein